MAPSFRSVSATPLTEQKLGATEQPMPDPTLIFGAAFLVIAGVVVFAVSRMVMRRGKAGNQSTMGERGRTDVGPPLFPPRPEVVDEPEDPLGKS